MTGLGARLRRAGGVVLALFATAGGGCRRGASGPASEAQAEPSKVVFRAADGRTLTLDELDHATGTIKYEMIADGDVPDEARALHERGRQAGGAGDYKEAIALLTKAAKLAPGWPYPIYDRAFTYLLMKDFDAARADYLATVKLAPRGYFTAVTSADLLVREKKGELPTGTCLAYSLLEDVPDPADKADRLRQLLARVPKLAPAWKDLAYLTEDYTEKLKLIEKGLAAQPDAETRGMLQINKALAIDKADHAAAVRLLGELILDPRATAGTSEMAKTSLALLSRQKPKK
jgi:tetratricopeptide (TPR) repeat protein